MKPFYSKAIVAIMIILMTLFLSSCSAWVLVAIEYQIDDITESDAIEFLQADEYEYLRVGETAIVPEIKVDEYEEQGDRNLFYIVMYSEKGNESVTVKDITIRTNEGEIIFEEPDCNITITASDEKEGYFEGAIKVDGLKVSSFNGIKNADLVLTIESLNETKTIHYVIHVLRQYRPAGLWPAT